MRLIAGTKGARPRDVHPARVDRALAAVRDALALLEASGQRYLVTRANGAATTGLKQAISVYKNVCDRAGIQSHSARYAFAAERMQVYRDQGLREREARAATSLDLGHGDGRGRHVAAVYARRVCPMGIIRFAFTTSQLVWKDRCSYTDWWGKPG